MPLRVIAASMLAGLAVDPVQYAAGSRQQELHDLIGSFRESARETVQARGPAAASLYDDRRVAEALARAQALAKAGKPNQATATLEDSYVYVESALIRLRDKESVVYDRTFRTPADEFRYLSGLYTSYAQIIDRQPLSPAEQRLVDDARARQLQAAGLSAKGAWAEANSTIEAAGAILLRVLESLGVMAAQ